MTTAYPLSWPPGFPRAQRRESGQFRTTLSSALGNVEKSLAAFGRDSGKPVSSIVLSSNVALGVQRPADPGIAAWFVWDGIQVCIPVDRYATPEANLQAIHHVVEARRVELRHGTLALVRATFEGFKALPAPAGEHWSDILAVKTTASASDIQAAYRRLASEHHPDRNGDARRMALINRARDEALKDRS
ncbi:J domain-containing protein [Microvirga antarctica]|uniref:J domain-containing protein n=1 Tax=Microvirga antarctica TaxID=2819233 RepID=UPI001B315B44|nr:J domain-containing protein [Microvirga antarctica]